MRWIRSAVTWRAINLGPALLVSPGGTPIPLGDDTAAAAPAADDSFTPGSTWHFKVVARLPGALPGESPNRWRDPAWSPCGDEIAFAGGDGVYFWTCQPGQKARRLTGGPIWSFAWAPDASAIAFSPQTPYSGARRDSIEFVDPRNDFLWTLEEGPSLSPNCIRWLDPNRLFFTVAGGGLRRVDIQVLDRAGRPQPHDDLDEIVTNFGSGGGGFLRFSGGRAGIGIPEFGDGFWSCSSIQTRWNPVSSLRDREAIRSYVVDVGGNIIRRFPVTDMTSTFTADGRGILGWSEEWRPPDPASQHGCDDPGTLVSTTLWLVDLESGVRHRLRITPSALAEHPTLSPDGKRLAWLTPGNGDLVIGERQNP